MPKLGLLRAVSREVQRQMCNRFTTQCYGPRTRVKLTVPFEDPDGKPATSWWVSRLRPTPDQPSGVELSHKPWFLIPFVLDIGRHGGKRDRAGWAWPLSPGQTL